MIAREGGSVGQPFTLQTKKVGPGKYLATYTKTGNIVNAINAKYRVLATTLTGQNNVSSWVPLKASCKIGGGPQELGS